LARGDGKRRRAAFKRRDALLKRVPCRVLDAGIDVAKLFQREQPRRVAGVLKLIGTRLNDRNRHRAARRVGPIIPAMQHEGLEALAVCSHEPDVSPGLCVGVSVSGCELRLAGGRLEEIGVMTPGDVGMRP
jgi:hypothetical protein